MPILSLKLLNRLSSNLIFWVYASVCRVKLSLECICPV